MEQLHSLPEKSFTGTGTGVTVKRVDLKMNTSWPKYITVTPVAPTAEPAQHQLNYQVNTNRYTNLHTR